MALLKDNDIKSGTASVNASVKGKLNAIKPELVASVDGLNLYNKPAQLSVGLNKAEVTANYDGKTASGEVNVNLLSQYIGLFIPLAHVNGSSGLKNTALIFNKSFAINFSMLFSSNVLS